MKKNTILKVLSVVLLLTFVLAALLTGCNGKQKEDITALQSDLKTAQDNLQAAEGKIATLRKDLDDLSAAVEKCATSTALEERAGILQGNIDALQGQLEDLETALAEQKTALEGEIADSAAVLDAKITTLTNSLNALSGRVSALATTVERLAAVDNFVDFKSATDLLTKAEINGEENPYTFAKFEAQCASLLASAYFETDYKAYQEYVYNLTAFVLRALTADEVKAAFADLAEFQAQLPTLVERFEQELLKLEGRASVEDEVNGIIDLNKDQLDDLDFLYNLIIDQLVEPDLGDFEEGQVDRYNDIQNAKYILINEFEAEAQTIARDAALDEEELPAIFTVELEGEYVTALESIEVLYKEEVGIRIANVNEDYNELAARLAGPTEEEAAELDEDELAAIARTFALFKDGVEEDFTGYSEAKAQAARFAQLTAAKDALVEVELAYFPLETTTEQPLFSDRDAIDADIAAIDAVLLADEYEISKEDDNYALILDAAMAEKAEDEEGYDKVTAEFIEAVDEYADLMVEIYNTYVNKEDGNVAEAIAAEIETGAENVLYTRIATDLVPLYSAMGQIHAAINAVNTALEQEFDAGNMFAMLAIDTEAKQAEINAIGERMVYLLGIKDDIDDVNAELVEKLEGVVTFDDGQLIMTGWAAAIREIFDVDDLRYWDYDEELEEEVIDEDGVNYINYLAMTEEFRANLAELQEKYAALKQTVQDIYDEVKSVVKADDDAVKSLVNLQKVLWADRKVSALQGVNTPNFVLDDPDEPDGTITFQAFREMLTARVLQLVALAEDADAEVVEALGDISLNDAIAALDEYNLNRTDEYKDVLLEVVEWIANYLNIDVTEYFGENVPAEPDEALAPQAPEFPDEPMIEDFEDEGEYQTAHEEWEGECAGMLDQFMGEVAEYMQNVIVPYMEELGDYVRNDMADYLLDLLYAVQATFQETATVDAEGLLNGDDGYILGIKAYNKGTGNADGNYTFIANFQAVIDAAEDYIETYAAAENEWNNEETGILAAIEALPAFEDIRIHDDEITEAYERYLQYQETYYAGEIVNDQFGELAIYDDPDIEDDDLLGKKDELDRKIKAAAKLYNSILIQAFELKTLFGEVPADNDVEEIKDRVADLRYDIAYYRANYCNGACGTDQCNFIGIPVPEEDMPEEVEDPGEAPAEQDYEDPAAYMVAYDTWAGAHNAYVAYIEAKEAWEARRDELASAGILDAELISYQMQAKAQIVQIIIDEIYYAVIYDGSRTYEIGTNPQDGTTLKTMYCKSIDLKTSIEYVIADYELFTNLVIDPELGNAADYPIESYT